MDSSNVKGLIKVPKWLITKKAINYNLEANFDDESCIILGKADAYIRFGNFNNYDNTIDVIISSKTTIYDLEFTTEGFIVEELIDGILSDDNFILSSDILLSLNNKVQYN